jgi:hypothetical protein
MDSTAACITECPHSRKEFGIYDADFQRLAGDIMDGRLMLDPDSYRIRREMNQIRRLSQIVLQSQSSQDLHQTRNLMNVRFSIPDRQEWVESRHS